MKHKVWAEALKASADPRRAARHLELLSATEAGPSLRKATLEQARVLSALFSGSVALTERLVAHPDWLPPLIEVEALKTPRSHQGFRRETAGCLATGLEQGDYGAAFASLRHFKERELLRIATRDLARLATVPIVTRELSDVADVCLDAVHRLCRARLAERLGEPWHQDPAGRWQATQFCVLGMGKLGGQELNYSSDVDVLFVYDEEGFVFKTPPRKSDEGRGLTSHQFFKRLAEDFIAEVGRLTPEGSLYRIDLRLRPDGPAGPLARSLDSYENYYAQWGQTWERMMLIKARCVAGSSSLAGEFLEMVQVFRFPRSLSDQALRDISGMKQRIEHEVVRSGEIDRNVKLGRGGIREIEFVVQTLQLLNAGHQPFLAGSQTLPMLETMVRYHLLPAERASQLAQAYIFLRDVEHRLQMEGNLQTHTIPTERAARERLARLMEFPTLGAFEARLDEHRRLVRTVYEELLQSNAPEVASGLPGFADAAAWTDLLRRHAFRDPDQALRLCRGFVLGPGFGHTSARTEDFARELLRRVLTLCPRSDQPPPWTAAEHPDGNPQSRLLSDPDRVLARLDTFVSAYGSRALLFETWSANPSLFDLLVLLFDRSEFLAESAIRTPDLVDDLELSGHLQRSKSVERTVKDLRYGLDDPDQRLWLRRYHQTEFMRIGLREILGLTDFEQNLVELSSLASACLQYALEAALRKHRMKSAPLAIIGLGKLGGTELNYGSDLDILFVADDKAKNLPGLQKVAVEVLALLGSQTELGIVYQIDARLRPDGEKGLLVNTLAAYAEYYEQRAWLWEIQAVSRSRFIAGNAAVGRRFQ
ncbi:MAG: bifunctional [glutamate--ammonia ligase]-adenylyl-L-tyrosine phosphorylase/[glutamate--ammonia-ligase] adenylyltransferase, partial [Limisphaerales bacterium]